MSQSAVEFLVIMFFTPLLVISGGGIPVIVFTWLSKRWK